MQAWIGVTLLVVYGAIASALIAAGAACLRGRDIAEQDHLPWFLGAIMLALIVSADRLRLVDGQLLILAALVYLWWDLPRRDSLERSGPLRRAGRIMLVAAAMTIGVSAASHFISHFVRDLRLHASGAGADSWAETVRISAEVARSDPSLSGFAALAPGAWMIGGTAVAIVWMSVLTGRTGQWWRRAGGLGMLAGAGFLIGIAWWVVPR